jgi:hypothetical protein
MINLHNVLLQAATVRKSIKLQLKPRNSGNHCNESLLPRIINLAWLNQSDCECQCHQPSA